MCRDGRLLQSSPIWVNGRRGERLGEIRSRLWKKSIISMVYSAYKVPTRCRNLVINGKEKPILAKSMPDEYGRETIT